MSRAKPKLSISEGQRLRVIAISVSASANETNDALIYWIYDLPREQWREILLTYRRSKREGDG